MNVLRISRRLAVRLSLLIAACLYFGTAAAGPALHGHGAGPTIASVGEKGSGAPADAPLPHSEPGCAACIALSTPALQATFADLPVVTRQAVTLPGASEATHTLRLSSPAQARSPPAA